MTIAEATNQVREWMQLFGQETPDKPTLPHVDLRDLRYSLNEEENQELFDADTTVKALDAIADLLYVVHGASVAYGFSGAQVEAAFKEVHRSNMSKMWTEEEIRFQLNYNDGIGIIKETCDGGGYAVVRKDGKILKSPSYSPAKLDKIVEGEV